MDALHTLRGVPSLRLRTRLPVLTFAILKPSELTAKGWDTGYGFMLVEITGDDLYFQEISDKGETIDYFHRCGTQLELEEALAGWLRKQITQIEEQRGAETRGMPRMG